MKKTTILLAGALAVLPCQPARAQTTNDPQPQVMMEIVCGLVVLGVGALVAIEMHKVCKKAFAPPLLPCGCNCTNGCGCPCAPPAIGGLTQFQGTNTTAAVLTDSAITYTASTNGWTDPVSGALVTATLTARLESSRDLATWAEEYSFAGWVSDTGILMLYSRAGTPVLTNYMAFNATNAVPLPIGSGTEPAKFFRLAQP